jgi:Cu/Ag efflux pump CusA
VEEIAIKNYNSVPVRVDIGSVQMGGIYVIFDANGGMVGGIVVMRYGENAGNRCSKR